MQVASDLRDAMLHVAGSKMNSMSRMRKSWLRTCEIPKALLQEKSAKPSWTPAPLCGPSKGREDSPQDSGTLEGPPLSPLQQPLWDGLGIDLDEVSEVSPESMKHLEDKFLQGLQHAGDRGEDISFGKQVEHTLEGNAVETLGKQEVAKPPALNLERTQITHAKQRKKTKLPPKDSMHEAHHIAQLSKDDVQPFLGAKLKKNLGKQGLLKQHISVQKDEWDDADVINMLGCDYSSKEEVTVILMPFGIPLSMCCACFRILNEGYLVQERMVKYDQWYNKNLNAAFVKKRLEARLRESQKLERAVMNRLSSHGRVSLVVANESGLNSTNTKTLRSHVPPRVLYPGQEDDVRITDLMRSRQHKVQTKNGLPICSPRRSMDRSICSSCPPLLVPNAREKLRQNTRFLDSRGKIHRISANFSAVKREFSDCLLRASSREMSGGQQEDLDLLESSMQSQCLSPHPMSSTPGDNSTVASANVSSRLIKSPLFSRPNSSEHGLDPQTRELISRHTVYPGLHSSMQKGGQKSRGSNRLSHRGEVLQTDGFPSDSPSHRKSLFGSEVAEVSSWKMHSPRGGGSTPLDFLIEEKV